MPYLPLNHFLPFFRRECTGLKRVFPGEGMRWRGLHRGTCRPWVDMSEYEDGYYSVSGSALDHFGMFRAFSVLLAGGFGRWTAEIPIRISWLGF